MQTFTAEERAIIDALRACPESRLSAEYPHHAELSTASCAALLGMHPAACRRLLRRALRKITLAIGTRPDLYAAVAAYYEQEANTKHNAQ